MQTEDPPTTRYGRRGVLRRLGGAGVAAAGVSLAGCSSVTDGVPALGGNSSDTGGNETPTSDGNATGDGGGNGDTSSPDENGGGDGDTSAPNDGVNDETSRLVELTDQSSFDPADVQVSVGTTVVWENVGNSGHSVTAYGDRIPDGAAYFASGGADSEEAARSDYPSKGKIRSKETFEHTFQTAGTYEYFCIPHEDDGAVGTVEVS